jgi:hypothetical protein
MFVTNITFDLLLNTECQFLAEHKTDHLSYYYHLTYYSQYNIIFNYLNDNMVSLLKYIFINAF